jgi:mitochondrial fission protein ELM1
MNCVENSVTEFSSASTGKPPVIWALLLPEAGFRSQVLGLAEAIGGTILEKNVDLRWPWSIAPSNVCPFPLLGLDPKLDPLAPPWPDLVIACGRRTIPLALAVKRASAGHTRAVYIQNPKAAAPAFDLVVSMRHDGLSGPHVMVVDTAIHRVTEAKLAAAGSAWAERFTLFKRPLLGVILGGRNRSFRFTERVAETLISRLDALCNAMGAGIIVTPSRRTEPEIIKKFHNFSARNDAVFLWDGTGDNPYMAMLALCDGLIVTEDSVSMISEALSSGKPVASVPLEGRSPRHEAFIDTLLRSGRLSRFSGEWPRNISARSPDVTAQAADRIRQLLKK